VTGVLLVASVALLSGAAGLFIAGDEYAGAAFLVLGCLTAAYMIHSDRKRTR
jgi:hypothetical protein